MSIKMVESFVDSLYVANKVMQEIEDDIYGHIEAYQNGREQGVLIWAIGDRVGESALYISHHRNSDMIVIREGSYSMQSISEDAYRNSYESKSLEDAVDYTVNRIRDIAYANSQG